MADFTLFDFAPADPEHLRPVPPAGDIVPQPGHGGHIGIPTRDLGHWPAFVDLGPVMQIQPGKGAELNPDQVRALGRALIDWAE